jgi:hypothetical protein
VEISTVTVNVALKQMIICANAFYIGVALAERGIISSVFEEFTQI